MPEPAQKLKARIQWKQKSTDKHTNDLSIYTGECEIFSYCNVLISLGM